jgi:hypothetical protein
VSDVSKDRDHPACRAIAFAGSTDEAEYFVSEAILFHRCMAENIADLEVAGRKVDYRHLTASPLGLL